MADLSGVRNLGAVLAGGPAIEQAAYNASQERLIRERGARALMERRVAQAAQEKIAADSLQNLINTLPPGRDRDILVSKLGSSFSGLQRGLGLEQQNSARGAAIEALLQGMDQDVINQFTGIAGDKPLTPNNVAVQRQAAAAAAKDEAVAALTGAKQTDLLPVQVLAEQALAGQRNASAALSDERRTNPTAFRASGSSGGVGLPPATTLALLFPPDTTGKSPELRQFIAWQAEQAAIDPAYADFYVAHRAWQNKTPATKPGAVSKADAVAEAFKAQKATNLPAAAEQAAAATTTYAPGYGNRADAETLIAAAQRKIDAGADPRAVEAILRVELEKRGFSYGSE